MKKREKEWKHATQAKKNIYYKNVTLPIPTIACTKSVWIFPEAEAWSKKDSDPYFWCANGCWCLRLYTGAVRTL